MVLIICDLPQTLPTDLIGIWKINLLLLESKTQPNDLRLLDKKTLSFFSCAEANCPCHNVISLRSGLTLHLSLIKLGERTSCSLLTPNLLSLAGSPRFVKQVDLFHFAILHGPKY